MDTDTTTTEAAETTTSAVSPENRVAPPINEQPLPPINADGTFREGWTKNENLAKKFTSFDSLIKSYESLEQMLGKDKISVPGENSTEDVWNEAYNKLGRPESPDKYEINRPEDLPEVIQWNEQDLESFKQHAHKIGLSQKQVQALVKFDADRHMRVYDGVQRQQQDALKTSEEALRKEWGSAWDDNLKLAQDAAKAIDESLITDPALGNNPKVLSMLAKVGSMLGEGKLRAPRDMVTPHTNVDSEISQIYDRNSGHWAAIPYSDPTHPDNGRATEYMQKLFARKYPGQ